MNQLSLADGVRFERVGTARELEASLGALPDGVRFGIACDLDERGQALRLDGRTHQVYHLRWDRDDVVIVIWGPMSTLFEAAILLSSIKSLTGPVDQETAVRLYRAATYRAELLVEPKRHPTLAPSSSRRAEVLTSALKTLERFWSYLRLRWRLSLQAASRT
ncbi:MAG TPA: hypothetical protein VFS23_12985 [Vicinamibacterales bacterium]|nr:hypothetical protein [Vicinamibacterales bacterium]